MIPAAGLGSRLGYGRPKCLVEIQGLTLLEWQLRAIGDIHTVVVVGYRHEEVTQLVGRIRPSAAVVHNADYATTGTSASVVLGASAAKEMVVVLDGDLLISRASFEDFLANAEAPTLGFSAARSSAAVGVRLESESVVAIGYEISSEWEWTGPLLISRKDLLAFGRGHVFENLIQYLPMAAKCVDCFEIDEIADLQEASSWLNRVLESGEL